MFNLPTKTKTLNITKTNNDNADKQKYFYKTNKEGKRILECSSKGDKRFSAFYALVDLFGDNDFKSIEYLYQNAKRFEGKQLNVKEAKGKTPTSMVISNQEFEIGKLTDFYNFLWFFYLDKNKHLVEILKEYDDYSDVFKGKNTVNCQADVIRNYMNEECNKRIREQIKWIYSLLKSKSV